MSKKIRTAVFPVAGRGTRFLPATKSSPKEMLPVVDKPLIQYAVEEALAAGVENLIFITGASKRAIEDHFDSNPELESSLEKDGKTELLDAIKGIVPDGATCVYVRQSVPKGLGHAVLCAKSLVGDEPFYVHLADDLIDSEVACLAQLQDVFKSRGRSILAVQSVPADQTDNYGIVAVDGMSDRVGQIKGIVEKPKPEDAPSNWGVVGRYVLTPRIFEFLETTPRGAGGEIQLTDAIAALMKDESAYAYEFDGMRYDCGSKLGYLQATVEFGLKHPILGPGFSEYLAGIVDELRVTAKTGTRN